MKKHKRREMTETIRSVADGIVGTIEMGDGSPDDALLRLRVIRADAQRIERLAAMLLGKTPAPPAGGRDV
ncbi:hypothetical protein [Ancylobacter sp.]|uniref:hypothetical protein n=1 Tax=Ancylobacter sp. TaxID=1872567 RepID=UPI003BA99F2E